MGAVLRVQDVNLLALLHLPEFPKLRDPIRPKFQVSSVRDSLEHISRAADNKRIRAGSDWAKKLSKLADSLSNKGPAEGWINPDKLFSWLERIRRHLVPIPIMASTLATSMSGYEEMRSSLGEVESVGDLAVFLTDDAESWNISYPTGPISLAGRELDAWPALVVWSRTGTCAVVPVSALPILFTDLSEVSKAQSIAPEERDRQRNLVLETLRQKPWSPKVLHLSDLHFGTEEAASNWTLLLNHLDRVVKEGDRVVITGDLMQAPNDNNRRELEAFLSRLAGMTRTYPVVIPGNHDEKSLYGSFWQKLNQVVRLDHQAVEVDDGVRCVFLGFDSSLEAKRAKGRVTPEDTKRVGDRFELTLSLQGHIQDYMLIALVHHHPLPFEASREEIAKYIQEWALESMFIGMEEGEEFVRWCGRRGVDLILHGHKHRPRLRDESVLVPSGRTKHVTVVGCGTSLGIRGHPLSYNVITWNGRRSRSSVAFFEGLADGSGFYEITSSLRKVEKSD